MKKALILLLITVLCLVFVACTPIVLKINFVVDGQVYKTVYTSGNETISMPQNPSKEGYTFDGWYWDDGKWKQPFTANSLLDAPLSSDMNVYAKWTEDDDKTGKVIGLTNEALELQEETLCKINHPDGERRAYYRNVMDTLLSALDALYDKLSEVVSKKN